MTQAPLFKPGIAVICLLAAFFLSACATTGGAPGSPDEDVAVSPLIRFYRGPLNHLSSVRQGQCPMHPSCSEYTDQAVEKHGPVVGWTMGLDRLMRCGRDETKRNRKIRVNGDVLFYDPVEENDGWFSDIHQGGREEGDDGREENGDPI